MTERFSGLEVEQHAVDGRHTLLLRGELDIASAHTLHTAVAELFTSKPLGLTLDLSELMFIDSTGLAEIILTNQLCERERCEFALIQGARAVQRLFELTGLIDSLPFQQQS